MTGWFARTVRIRSDEQRDVAAAFLTLLGSMCGHAMLETARDALFLGNISARRLPLVYLAIAVLALLLAGRTPAFVARFSPRSELSAWLLFSSGVSLALFAVLGTGANWVYFVLYVWSGLLATLVVVRFWIVVGALFTVTQAKRVYAVIGTGSVLGAILGSAVSLGVAALLPARWLVLAAAFAFALASLAPLMLTQPRGVTQDSPTRPGQVLRSAVTAWEHPYLRHVGGLVLLATVTFTLVDFVFKSAVSEAVAPEQLDKLFSSVYLTLNVVSLGVQVIVVPRLLRQARVSAVIALVPMLILGSAIGFAIVGGLTLALVLKGSDGSLRHSLYRTTTELLFLPVAGATRARLKTAIDVVGQRGGQALGSVVILVGLGSTADFRLFAWVTAATAGTWLYIALQMRRHYLTVVRESVTRGVLIEDTHLPELDVTALEVLLRALNDPVPRRAIAALDVIEFQGKEAWIPALVLYHPSAAVVERALDVLVGVPRADCLEILPRLWQHPEPGVRAGAVRLLAVSGSNPLPEHHEDDDPSVRAVAALGRLAHGGDDPRWHTVVRHELAKSDEPELKIQVARSIAVHQLNGFEDLLVEWVEHSSQAVSMEAMRGVRRTQNVRAIPTLIRQFDRPDVRDRARAVLVSLGQPALHALVGAMTDSTLAPAVGDRVPRALAAFRTQEVGDVLQERLLAETDALARYRIIRGLGRWRSDQPFLKVGREVASRLTEDYLEQGRMLIDWRRRLVESVPEDVSRTELHLVLMKLLNAQARHTLECSFRLLNVRDREDDYRRIFVGLESPSERFRARSRELLDLMAPEDVRSRLLPLVDALVTPPEDPADESSLPEYQRTLTRVAEMTDGALRDVANATLSAISKELAE